MANRRALRYGSEAVPMPPMTAAGRPGMGGGGMPQPMGMGGRQAPIVPPPTPIPDVPEDPRGSGFMSALGSAGRDVAASGGLAGLLPMLIKALLAQQWQQQGQAPLPSKRVMGANPLTPGPTAE